MNSGSAKGGVLFRFLGQEPFRIFFPMATLAGIVGGGLWPLNFSGDSEFYPGLGHARIMAYGLFGGFIIGFLGTAMPKVMASHYVYGAILWIIGVLVWAVCVLPKVLVADTEN